MATHSVTHDHAAFLRRVKAALADGTDPATAIAGFPDEELAETAFLAVHADCPRLLAALIEHRGVDVNGLMPHKDHNYTSLGLASCLGAARCVAALISHGADVNAKYDCCGEAVSPVFLATYEGHVPVMRQLVDAGASLDGRHGQGQLTPLHVAAQRGHVGVVALLMQRGADTRAADVKLQHPISHAVSCSRALCVKALLPHADVAHADAQGLTLLHQAVLHAGPEILGAILPSYAAAGLLDIPEAKVHADRNTGLTALMLACQKAKGKEVELLLQAGASRHLQDSRGGPPLVHCILGKSLEYMKLLLGDDALKRHYTTRQLTNPDDTHASPLACAAHDGRADMCALLIAAGADPSGIFERWSHHMPRRGAPILAGR